jgi:membrane protease YdiL (CAAX protease family)
VVVGGSAGASSLPAGWLFAAVLLIGVAGARAGLVPRRSPRSTWLRAAFVGVGGFAVLVAGPLAVQGVHVGGRYAASPLAWMGTVVIIAVSEETLLRGALFDAVVEAGGPGLALVTTTVAFALIHVPLYGWRSLPLDLAVGAWLGGLRVWATTPLAPALAHALADLAAWWL